MKNKMYILITSILLLIVGCSKPAPSPDPQMSLMELYIRTGSQWRYLAVNSVSQTDTLMLKVESIGSSTTLYNSNYLCGIYINGVRSDSAVLTISDLGLTLTPLSYRALFQGFELVFPLYNNQTWSAGWDSSHVSYLSTYTGIDSVYHTAYQINHYASSIGVGETQTIVIVPYIGIVYRSYNGNTYGSQHVNSTYTLIDYKM